MISQTTTISWLDKGRRVNATPVGWAGTMSAGRILVMDATEEFHLVELHEDGSATVLVGPISIDEALDRATDVLSGRPTAGAVERQFVALAVGVHVLSCMMAAMAAEVRP